MLESTIVAVVVHYGSAATTAGAVESLRNDEPALPIWVVDNGPDERSTLVSAIGADVPVLGEGRNLGYGGGANLALARAAAEGFEYVLLVNSDARFTEGSIEHLVSTAVARQAGLAAPLVLYQDGETIWAEGLTFRAWHGISRNGKKGRPSAAARREPYTARYVTGCVMLIRVDEALRFDPGFFLYYEDIDICDRAREQRMPIVIDPISVVTHPKPGQARHRFGTTQQHHMAKSGIRYGRLRTSGIARYTYWLGFFAITAYRLARSDSLASARFGMRGLVEGFQRTSR